MKKYSKNIVLVAAAVSLMIGTPYITAPGTCGLTLPVAFTGAILGCGGEKDSSSSSDKSRTSDAIASENKAMNDIKGTRKTELKVTLVELGSVNCVPCKMMQPVMEKVEQAYPGQVRVIFHDVWTAEGRSSGAKYSVRVIPTQVFLDKDGKEYFRHEGFLSFEEVDKILKQKGVN
jgi:thioredoxin 1